MTDEQLQTEIYNRTGKVLGDYGFIAGTSYPVTSFKGMMSATMVNGFTVWKIVEGKTEMIELNPQNQDECVDQICNFLNQGAVV